MKRQELLGEGLTAAEIDNAASAVEKVQEYQELCRKVESLEQMATQQLLELEVILQKYKSIEVQCSSQHAGKLSEDTGFEVGHQGFILYRNCAPREIS